MSKKLEDIFVRDIAQILTPKFEQIWTNKKPSASKHFRNKVELKLGYIPILQPEIDLCLLTKQGNLVAVEVKVIRDCELRYDTPFYEGIGQTLALHRYGFDAVALWHLFPNGVNTKGINRYGAEAWAFIRNDLCLPLDFSYIAITKNKDINVYSIMQYTGRQNGYQINKPLNDPGFVLTWKHPNPIKCFPTQIVLRNTLEWYLKIKA